LAASDEELLARHGRWYIPRRQPRYLRRNALVVLGNVGDGANPKVEAALRRALADADPMLRSHAQWAAQRLGRTDLIAA
jgi:epoxyqueuosine reductase